MYMFKQLNFNRKSIRGTNTPAVVQTSLSPLHQKRAPTAMVDALSYRRL